MGEVGPNALARFDYHARDLGVVSEKMLDQVQAEIFQWLDGMLACQSVHGIFHGVRGEDFAIVAFHVGSFKIALEANRECDLADIVATLLFGNAQ